MGVAPYQYVLGQRMENGCADQSRFTRHFKKTICRDAMNRVFTQGCVAIIN